MTEPNRKHDDAWMRGYAAGLAAATRVTKDYTAARYALRNDNLTVEMLERAGAAEFDLAVLPRGDA